MSWTRILAPLTGAPADQQGLNAAMALAAPFDAVVSGVFAPADAADLMPWMGEGFMGGVQMAALDSMKEAAAEGERASRSRFEALGYDRKEFKVLSSPVWACLCMEARLCDVAVFGPDPARGRGPLVEAFQQILMEERRPVFVARQPMIPRRPWRWPGTAGVRPAAPPARRFPGCGVRARSSSCWLRRPRHAARSGPVAGVFASRGVAARIEQLTA